jgi:hypothetical protein
MKTTLTAVRVDFGAVGGHLQPSELFVSSVRASVEEKTDIGRPVKAVPKSLN